MEDNNEKYFTVFLDRYGYNKEMSSKVDYGTSDFKKSRNIIKEYRRMIFATVIVFSFVVGMFLVNRIIGTQLYQGSDKPFHST